jgi:hypothetical protein
LKKQKEEGNKKAAEKAKRKEERDKHRKLQGQVGEEEESSSIDDDDDDDDEGEVHQYDWLDSMAEEGEQPGESSLLIEGRLPQAEPPHRESEDPDLGGATATSEGEEPQRPQELVRSKGAEETRPQKMAGSLPPLPQPDTAETVGAEKRPYPMIVGSGPSEPSWKRPRPMTQR